MESFRLVRPPESISMKSSRIKLSPGEEVGRHVTEGREEVIIVLRGQATLVKETETGNRIMVLNERDAHFIGKDISHNVKNESGEEVEYVYVANTLGQN